MFNAINSAVGSDLKGREYASNTIFGSFQTAYPQLKLSSCDFEHEPSTNTCTPPSKGTFYKQRSQSSCFTTHHCSRGND